MWKFNGNDKDLLGDMESTVLGRGEEVDVTDSVEVNVCGDTTFVNTTNFITDEP